MDATLLIARLERFPDALDAAVLGVRGADWDWRPKPEAWSLLDVVNHLVSEETEDFRARLASTLEDPKRQWPKLDPEARVVELRATSRDPQAALARFRADRAASVAWLSSVAAGADWNATHPHPSGRPIRAGDLLASWAAHDARHLEQIAKRLYGLVVRDGGTYDVGYAG
jgi:hypothetical protein